MNRHSSGARNAAYALIAGACAWLVGPSSGALAQDTPPEARATSAAPAEAATQSRRDRRRAEQDKDEDILELLEQDLPRRDAMRRLNLIRTKLCQTSICFAGAETCRITIQLGKGLIGALCMPEIV